MATIETVCKFYQSGYCKFQTHCRKSHVHNICQNHQCADRTCVLRHPRVCKYFSNLGSCKFNSACAYLHTSDLHKEEISRLKAEIQKLEDKINSIDVKLSALRDVDKTNVENMNEETVQSARGSTQDRLSELETNFYILMNAVDDVERSTKVLNHNFAILEEELKKPKCSMCDENFPSKSTLANHIRKQHANLKT